MTPRRHARPEPTADVPMPDVAGVRHRFVELTDVTIHVAELGEGPPLMLLHGWPQHWYCWHRVAPRCAGFRLVMPDMRGFGWSSAPVDDDYRKETLVDDLVDVMDALEIPRAGIVGHDWGGWTGFLAALRHPERVAALLAVSIVHPFTRPGPSALAQSWRFAYQPLIAAPFGRTLVRQRRIIDRLLTANTDAIAEPGIYSSVLEQAGRGRASQQLYRTFLLHELPRLGRYRSRHLAVPTSLVVGDRDPVIRPSMLAGFEDHATDMTLEMLAGVGHFVPEQAADELAGRVVDRFAVWRQEHAAVASGGSVAGVGEGGGLLVEGPNSA